MEDCLFINTVYIFLCEHDWIHSAEQDILDGVMAAIGVQSTLLSLESGFTHAATLNLVLKLGGIQKPAYGTLEEQTWLSESSVFEAQNQSS